MMTIIEINDLRISLSVKFQENERVMVDYATYARHNLDEDIRVVPDARHDNSVGDRYVVPNKRSTRAIMSFQPMAEEQPISKVAVKALTVHFYWLTS